MSRRLHLLVLGQSNVASHGQGRRASAWGTCWSDGKAYPLADPLPGGSGKEGSVWTRLAPLLERRGDLESFAVTVLAQGGTSMADWAVSGKCHARLLKAAPVIHAATEPVSHVLYHQGERDTLLKTGCDAYFDGFVSLHQTITKLWPGAPIIVCTASHRMGVRSEAVRLAQRRIQTELDGCIAGPDTDTLGSALRRDDTHFNEEGLAAFADLLAAPELWRNHERP